MEAFDPIEINRGVIAALDALTALVWATLAQSIWRARGTARPQGTLMHLVRIMSGLMAVHFGIHVVLDLIPFEEDGLLYLVMCQLTLMSMVGVLPVLRHMVPLGSIGEKSPGRLWLAVNYGSAVAVLAVSWFTGPHVNLDKIYLSLMTAIILWDAGRLVRRRWRPVFMADLRFGGFLALAFILAIGVVATILTETPPAELSLGSSGSRAFLALALAVPFAMRILGEVVRRFLVSAVKLGSAAVVYIGVRLLIQGAPTSQLALLLGFGAALALVWVLGSGGLWLCACVDRLVLHRSHLWGQHLRSFVHTLTPELGVAECCRRSVEEVVREFCLRGGGILFEGTSSPEGPGERWTHDRLDLEPIARVWPDGEELPASAFDLLWLKDVELQVELYEAGVTWIVPIRSPQKRWGYLFIVAGPIGTAASDAKLEILESFAHQLALVLDTADLLERAVSVERELAKSEKMAALGETAARIAHEIRNPVTAARSLAQLVADEPTSPRNVEHSRLVVRELDRVERQVKAMLHFARGEEGYRLQPVCLAELVGRTMADLEPCYKSAGLEIALDLGTDVTVRADPECFRQVVVNLVSNAVDALGETPSPRQLKVSVAPSGDDALLAVEDSGVGVPREILPRLFEPFVSRKAQGTGLGLVIAKRIVEAHQGRIEAQPGADSGMIFKVRLPLAA